MSTNAAFLMLNDNDPFPFGAHKGKKMKDVPSEYLDWMVGQSWASQWKAVVNYVERNRKSIDQDLKEKGLI